VSKAEIKHANNKVIVNVYVYNRNKKFLLLKYKTIYKKLLNTKRKNLNKKTLNRRSKKRIIRMSLLNYYKRNISKINKTCLVSPFLSVQHTLPSREGKTAISCFLSLQGEKKKHSLVKQNVIKKKKWFFYKLINFCNTFPVSESLNNIYNPAHKEFSLCAGLSLSNYTTNSEKLELEEENTKKVSRKKNYYFMKHKIRLITVKSLRVLKKARSHRKLILNSLKWNNRSFKTYEIKCYKNYLSKLYVKEMLCLYYMQLLVINSNKFKS